jgi:hypothetical protein
MIKKHFQKIRNHIQEVLRIKETPNSIAIGFAIATFIALLPTFGLGVFIGLGIILIFKKISKVSLLGGFAFWNPVVLAPFYTLSYIVGDLIYLNTPGFNFQFEINEALYIYSIKFLIGNFIVVIAMSLISYFVIKSIATKYQKQYKTYFADPIEKNLIDPIEELI